MKCELFVTDFDGTLVDHTLNISDNNKTAIKKLMDKGIKFAICSGRSHIALAQYEVQLNNDVKGCFGVGYNGAKIYKADTREVIFEKKLKSHFAKDILKDLKSFNAPTLVYVNDDLFMEKIDTRLDAFRENKLLKINYTDDLSAINSDFTKILVCDERPVLNKLYDYLYKKANGRYNVFFSAENLLEFTDIEATKGNAIKFLANHLNINLENVIACGDNYNDITMIKEVGTGVAMKNAVDELKSYADYVTENFCYEDAIAEVINNFCLD